MEVCHGVWIPASDSDFDNHGQFIFWVETPTPPRGKIKDGIHSKHLAKNAALEDFLTSVLTFNKATLTVIQPQPVTFYATLPSHAGQPLPSMEMAQLSGEYPPDEYEWQAWAINGLAIAKPLLFLRELQFIASLGLPNVRLGSDLLFWMQYAQHLRHVIRQHQFLPVMKCHQPEGKAARLSFYTGWSPVGSLYERGLQDFAAAMPGICTAVSNQQPDTTPLEHQPTGWDGVTLLRHFAEQQLETLVRNTSMTKQLLQQLGDSWLVDALGYNAAGMRKMADINDSSLNAEHWRQWHTWQRGIVGQTQDAGFVLGLRLHPANNDPKADWWLSFFVESSQDPWGNRIDAAACRAANMADQSILHQYPDWQAAVATCHDGYVHTSPVSTYQANGYGLADMHGNVWEWVQDCYHENYHAAPKDGSAWESQDCQSRSLRGGSWFGEPGLLSSADRFGFEPDTADFSIGFRVARSNPSRTPKSVGIK